MIAIWKWFLGRQSWKWLLGFAVLVLWSFYQTLTKINLIAGIFAILVWLVILPTVLYKARK